MCDVKKYEEIFQEIKKLTPEEATEIELSTKDKETRDFYAAVESIILQKRQAEYIKNESY